MRRCQAQFEKATPEEHPEFLEFPHIPSEEVKSIRQWSREAKQ